MEKEEIDSSKNSVKQDQIHDLLFNREIGWQEIIYDLINTEQLDPWDIDITVLTEGYLQKIQNLEEADFFVSSKVLLAAALLLRIKSEILLNKHIKSIDEILSVDGRDVGFVGFADLSLSMGLGLPPKWDEPRYLEAYDRVVKAANKWGKIAGIHTNLSNDPGNVNWAIERGFRMVTVSELDAFIIQGARAALERAREAGRKVKPGA